MALPATTETCRWQWPINVALYDRAIELTPSEHSAIAHVLASEWKCWRWTPDRLVPLNRLVRPIADALMVTRARTQLRAGVLKILMLETGRFGRTLWGWTETSGSVFFATPSQNATAPARTAVNT
jgi:hypothetical protein